MACPILNPDPIVLKLNPPLAHKETLEAESLIERARGGNADAFCKVCCTLESRLLRQALSLCGNFTVAEDLAQETLIEAWKFLHRYNGRCQLFTWLCAIMLNRYRNMIRQQRGSGSAAFATSTPDDSENRASQLIDQEPWPNETIQRREQAALVHQCIRALPQKHQDVIYLRFYIDDSLEGIAAALGCSLGTVKSRLFHALEKLRRMDALREQMRIVKPNFERYETLL
jgi:RNA polymerase sigma-70 factor, ECF subfamily